MSVLFESTSINAMVLKNRFVRSATWEALATEDGMATDKLITVWAQLARGGVGLIISGHAYVSREGQAGPWQLGAYSDECIPDLPGPRRRSMRSVPKSHCSLLMQGLLGPPVSAVLSPSDLRGRKQSLGPWGER